MQELQELQVKFDAAAVKKHKLHKELDSCIQRVEAATTIVERFYSLVTFNTSYIQTLNLHAITECFKHLNLIILT